MADEAKAKGNAAFSAGYFNEAVRHFTDGISFAPTNHVLYSNRSAAYASLNKFSDALSDAQRTVELKPYWRKGYSRLGAAHMGLHNYSDAVSAYKKGLEIDPTNAALESGLADAEAASARSSRPRGGPGASPFEDPFGPEMLVKNEEVNGGKKNKSNKESNNNNNNNNNNGNGENKSVEALPREETIGDYIFVNNNDTMAENLKRQLVVVEPITVQNLHNAPIVSSYNDRIRPLLDTVDHLRHLKITQEGIQLPTIVVVGDQSSGKSSVLESLAGINLPRGQGICTRVPLIMRLQNHSNPNPALSLEFNGKIVSTDEENISDAISFATEEIAGKGKGISNTPLTLVVKKKGVPDLTMVDLPGITRVPVHGQPEDIYEQISKIITEFITPEESILLNVLSASVDFSTCDPIRMSQRVDKTGQRTLAVVTKADKSPEGLLEKVTADDVNIGLGYVCVRNRIGDESYAEARAEEARLFETHPQLSKISKSMVGVPVLADRLVKIQAAIIVKCLPDIVRNINEKLSSNLEELNKMPKHLTSIAEAMTSFMDILANAKDSLRKIILQGDVDEYPDNVEMHCRARLADMLNKYADEIKVSDDESAKKNFLLDEIKVLEESKSIRLPNFLPTSAFRMLLQKKVKGISAKPVDFVEKVWTYVEKIVIPVLLKHCDNYPQLTPCTRRAGQNLISKKKEQSVGWVNDMVEMEKLTDYTCNPQYMDNWNKLMAHQVNFMNYFKSRYVSIYIDGFGDVNIGHLHDIPVQEVQEAFDVKMRMTAYWDIVLRRMMDNIALHLLLALENLVNKEIHSEIINGVVGPQGNGLERMLEQSPSTALKRNKLEKSIKLLKAAKDVVANIMDSHATNFD